MDKANNQQTVVKPHQTNLESTENEMDLPSDQAPCNEIYVEILASDVTGTTTKKSSAKTIRTKKKSRRKNMKFSGGKKRGANKSQVQLSTADKKSVNDDKKIWENDDTNENEDEDDSETVKDDDNNSEKDEVYSVVDIDLEYNLRVDIAKKNEGSYQCFQCAKIFRTFPDLCHHLYEHNPDGSPKMCEKCGTGFATRKLLETHNGRTFRFPQEMPYECKKCDKGFTTEYLLKFHMESHKIDNVLECQKCNQGFDCGSSFLNHYRNGICHSSKSTKNDYNYKKNWHWTYAYSIGSRPFTCNSCELDFLSPSDLFIHMETHGEGEETFICLNCGYGYKGLTNEEIEEHKKGHETGSPNKETQCDVCDRHFTSIELIVLHKKTHYGLPNYECRICRKRYNDGYELLDHLKDPNVKCMLPRGKDDKDQTDDLNTCNQSEPIKMDMCKFTVGNKFCSITRQQILQENDNMSDDNEDKVEDDYNNGDQVQDGHENDDHVQDDHEIEDKVQDDHENEGKIQDDHDNADKVQDYNESIRDNDDDAVQDYGSAYSCMSLHLNTVENFVYKCDSCDHTCKTYMHMYYHLYKQHGFRQIQICDSCGLGIEDPKTFLSHKIQHHDKLEELMYECSLCAERFIHSSLLIFHNQVVHQGRKRLYCERCELGFHSGADFVKHYKRHSGRIMVGSKPSVKKKRATLPEVECEACMFRCKDEPTLKHHSRHMHKNECEPCKKKFPTIELYMSHIKTHYEDFPYKCGLCGYNYDHIKDLIHHINIHKMKEKTWHVCRICKKRFLDKENLMAHRKVHKCRICGLILKHMEGHRRLCRGRSRVRKYDYNCPYCGRGYMNIVSYKKHLASHKPKAKYRCDVCKNSIFFHAKDLRRHLERRRHRERVLLNSLETDKKTNEKERSMNTQEKSDREKLDENMGKLVSDILDDGEVENSKPEMAPKFVFLEPEKPDEKFVLNPPETGLNPTGTHLNPRETQLELNTQKSDTSKLDSGQSVVNLLAMTTENVEENDKIGDQSLASLSTENVELQASPLKTVVKMSNKTLANLKTYQKLLESAKKTQANLDGESVVKLLQETKEIQENTEQIKVDVNKIIKTDESETKTTRKATSKSHSAVKEKRISSSGRNIKRPPRFQDTFVYPSKAKIAKTENEITNVPQFSIQESDETKYHECVQNILSAMVKVERMTDDDIANYKHAEKENPNNDKEQNPDVNSLPMGSATKHKRAKIGPKFTKNINRNEKYNIANKKRNIKNEESQTQESDAIESNDTKKQDAGRSIFIDMRQEFLPDKPARKKQENAIRQLDTTDSPIRKSDRKRASSLKLQEARESGYNAVGVKRLKVQIETNDKTAFQKPNENKKPETKEVQDVVEKPPKAKVSGKNNESNLDKNKQEVLKSILEKRRELQLRNVIDSSRENFFQCSDCDAKFSNYRYLFLHTNAYHSGSSCYLCFTCGYGKGYHPTPITLKKLEEEHKHKPSRKDFPFRCKQCNPLVKYFKYKGLRDLHIEFEHKKTYNTCDICGKQFAYRYFHTFVTHYKSCFKNKYGHYLTGDKDCKKIVQYKPKKSENEQDLYWYLKERSNSMFNCGVCREGFWKIEEFYLHLYLHTDENHTLPYLCINCGYGTVGTRNHGKRHNGKPLVFRCKIGKCKETFLKAELLVFHERTHADDYVERYECFLCNLECRSLSELMNHFPVCKNIEENRIETTKDCQQNSDEESEKSDITEGIENEEESDRLTGSEKVEHETGVELVHVDKNIMETMSNEQMREKLLDLMKEMYMPKELRSFGFINDESEGKLKDGLFFCEVCEDTFDDYTTFYEHLHEHSGNKSVICLCCGRGSYLREHARKPWLAKHNRPHPDQNFSCDQCDLKFVKQELLDIHKVVHQGRGLLICKECGRDFQMGHAYLAHSYGCTKRKSLLSTSGRDGEKNSTTTTNNESYSESRRKSTADQIKTKKSSFHALPSAIEVKFNIHEKRHLRRQKMLRLKNKYQQARKVLDAARKKQMSVKKDGIKCFVCQRFFKYSAYLCLHGRSYDYPNAKVCKQCGRIFKDASKLKDHMQRVHGEKLFRCHICFRAFGLRKDLYDHLKRIHKLKPEVNVQDETDTPDHNYMDPVNVDGTIQEPKFHLITNPENAPRDRSQPDDYRKHVLQKDGKNVCNICGKIFLSKKMCVIRKHILTHIGEKTLLCSICNYSCVFTSQLRDHNKTCHGESQKCNFCNKVLVNERSARLHMERVHKDLYIPEKRIKCNFCGQRFLKLKECLTHKRLYHSNIKYSCNVCGHSLASARGLRRHIERVHDIKTIDINLPTTSTTNLDVPNNHKTETEEAAAYIQQYLQTSPPKKLSKLSKGSKQKRSASESSENGKPVIDINNERAECNSDDDLENVTTEDFFMCDKCGKLFFSGVELKFHIKNTHNRKVWACNICAKVFSKVKERTKHRKQFHPDVLTDVLCFTESIHDQINEENQTKQNTVQNQQNLSAANQILQASIENQHKLSETPTPVKNQQELTEEKLSSPTAENEQKLSEANRTMETSIQNQQKLAEANQTMGTSIQNRQKLAETNQTMETSIQNQQKLADTYQFIKTLSSSSKDTARSESSKEQSGPNEKIGSKDDTYVKDISEQYEEDVEMDDTGSLPGVEDTTNDQMNLSKTFSSDFSAGSPVKRLWDTFQQFSETGELSQQVLDMPENIDRVKVLSDMDGTSDGLYTATRLELSPMKKILSLESNTSSSSLEMSPMKRTFSSSTDTSQSAIIDKDTRLKVNSNNIKVESWLPKTEIAASSTITETVSCEPKTSVKIESMPIRPSMRKIPSQKDFTPNEIDIASSLLELDSPMMPNSPVSGLSKIASSPYILNPDNVEGTIEKEVTIETTDYEIVTIDRGRYAMDFDMDEATNNPTNSAKKANDNNTIKIQPLKLDDKTQNTFTCTIKSEASGNEGGPIIQDIKMEVLLPSETNTGDSQENNLPGTSTEENSLTEHTYSTSNDGKDVKFGSIEIGNNKPDEEVIFDQVINVPGRLNKPFQTMIKLPDNSDEIQNTVVNLPSNVKSVDLTVANMENDDEDVYLLFFV